MKPNACHSQLQENSGGLIRRQGASKALRSIGIAGFALTLACTSSLRAGDWGKAPVEKEVIEECLDLGGTLELGYHTDYLFKGLLIGGQSVSTDIKYQVDGLSVPLVIGIGYINVISPNEFANIFNDELTLSAEVGLPTVAGIEASLSYAQRYYPEDPNTALWPSSNGEIGLHLSKDLKVFVVSFNAYRNLNTPNSWNGTIPTLANQESGAWYWDLGISRSFPVTDRCNFVLGGGIAFADNYWGTSPNSQTGGRSSGWNHYYLSGSLPVELNCRTTITPYVGYMGAPEGFLMDGAPDFALRPAQSDLLHGGVTLSVTF